MMGAESWNTADQTVQIESGRSLENWRAKGFGSVPSNFGILPSLFQSFHKIKCSIFSISFDVLEFSASSESKTNTRKLPRAQFEHLAKIFEPAQIYRKIEAV